MTRTDLASLRKVLEGKARGTSRKSAPNISNDWGAFAGGAIIKNKLFYFGSHEQNTVRGLGVTRLATVPTARVLSRNRS